MGNDSYKVIIAGKRSYYPSPEDITKALSQLPRKATEIISGGAAGADACGELWANENSTACIVFKARWQSEGKLAGKIRNREMGDYADALVAFWDGDSPGTGHMIAYMTMLGKQVIVVDIREL